MTKVKYSKELMENACKNAKSIAQVCRNLGLKPVGGNYKTVTRKMEEYNIDSSHFTGQNWNKGLKHIEATSRIPLEEILKENISYHSHALRERLINAGLKENKCEICGHSENLELHHINGDHYDNRLENLQILCPNCHAKTDNFRGRNSNKNTTPETLSKKYAKSHYCICKNCEKEFYSDRTDKTRKFCSVECYREYLQKLQYDNTLEPLQEQANIEIIRKLTKENLIKESKHCKTIKELADIFRTSRPTIRKYLIKYDLYEDFKLKYDFHAKEVIQLDSKLNIIKEWPSITDAGTTLNVNERHIGEVCRRKRRSAGGFIWKYKEI